MLIAIDGPAGAGKSSVARLVAGRLGYLYVDTGAMYRALAWLARERGLQPQDQRRLADLADTALIEFQTPAPGGEQSVAISGHVVTGEIRSPEISQLTSTISAIPAVRRAVVRQQRELVAGAERGVVVEGRDIGTVVFPDAPVKVYLMASPEERARRRVEQMRSKGDAVDFAAILDEQRLRDERDSTRADSPLRPAPESVVIDTERMDLEEVVARVLEIAAAAASR